MNALSVSLISFSPGVKGREGTFWKLYKLHGVECQENIVRDKLIKEL